MKYDLKFEIEPELYIRASTQPFTTVSKASQEWRHFRNFFGTLCFFGAVFFIGQLVFSNSHPLATIMGAVFGAVLVLLVWWKQHRSVVKHYSKYNDTAGQQHMVISADGVFVARTGIETRLEWDFVETVWTIDAATLIDLGNARLIIPHCALPPNASPNDFEADLTRWKAAA